MKDTNYVVIQGWMVNQLKLAGNELMVYAIIYGFSQDRKSKFKGSGQYIAKSAGISRRSVSVILNTLVKKKYIKKFEYKENEVKHCDYMVSVEYLPKENTGGIAETAIPMEETAIGDRQELPRGMEESSTGGIAETANHITNQDNISIIQEDKFCGESPPEKNQRKKSEKPRLRDREPENDMELVEKAYWTNWDMLYSKQLVATKDPRVNWGQTRKLIKSHFEKNITPEQLVFVVNKALQDNWILEHGYSLEKILTCQFVNGAINKINFPPSTETELVVSTPLYSTAIQYFEKDLQAKALLYQDDYSKKMQFQCLREIAVRCKNMVPDMPIEFMRDVLAQFRLLCYGRYRGKWSFTPRCLKTDWVWELVIDSLPKNNITPELSEKIRRISR